MILTGRLIQSRADSSRQQPMVSACRPPRSRPVRRTLTDAWVVSGSSTATSMMADTGPGLGDMVLRGPPAARTAGPCRRGREDAYQAAHATVGVYLAMILLGLFLPVVAVLGYLALALFHPRTVQRTPSQSEASLTTRGRRARPATARQAVTSYCLDRATRQSRAIASTQIVIARISGTSWSCAIWTP
jgi:hypothetical protein